MANEATIKVKHDKGIDRFEKKLQKVQQVTGSAGTALSGLGSTFSALGPQAGAAGGAISNVAGMLATGGALGVAIGAAVAGTALLITKFMDAKQASKELVAGLDEAATALTDIRDKMALIEASAADKAAFAMLKSVHKEQAALDKLIERREAFLKARGALFSGGEEQSEKGYEGFGGAMTAAYETVSGAVSAPSERDIMIQRIRVRAAKAAVGETRDLVVLEEEHNDKLKKKNELQAQLKKDRGEYARIVKSQNEFETKARLAQEQYLRDQQKAEQELNAWLINDEWSEWEAAQKKKQEAIQEAHKEYMALKTEEKEAALEAIQQEDVARSQSIIQYTAEIGSFIAAQTQLLLGNEEKKVEKITANLMNFIGQKFFAEGIGLAMKGAGEGALGNPGGAAAVAMGLGLAGFGLTSMTSAPFIAGNNQNIADRLNKKKDTKRSERRGVDAPVGRLSTGKSEARGSTTTVVYNFNAPVYNEDEAARAVWRMNNRGSQLENAWQ